MAKAIRTQEAIGRGQQHVFKKCGMIQECAWGAYTTILLPRGIS